jgi:transcriptional regulator with XRE-family HTH domain
MTEREKEEIIHSFFKTERESRELSLIQMAQFLSISPRNYWNLENSSLRIQKRTMDHVAKKIGKHPAEIFYPDVIVERIKEIKKTDKDFNFFRM